MQSPNAPSNDRSMLDIGQRSHQRASLVTTTDHAINKPDVVCMTKRSASLQDPCGVGWTKVTLLSDVILLMSPIYLHFLHILVIDSRLMDMVYFFDMILK